MNAKVIRNIPLFFFIALAGSAQATTVTATSYSAWVSDLTGSSTLINFNGLSNGTSYSSASGYAANPGPFVFTGPDGASYTLAAYQFSGTLSLEGPTDGTGYINVAMPTGGENAIVLKLATTGGTPITVALSDGETFSPAAGVFGLSISHDINWLQVSTTSGSAPVIEWAYYGASDLTQDSGGNNLQPAGEVATAFLFAGGLLVVVGSQKKVRRILFA